MAQLKADFTIDVITDFEIGRSVGTQIRNDFVAVEEVDVARLRAVFVGLRANVIRGRG